MMKIGGFLVCLLGPVLLKVDKEERQVGVQKLRQNAIVNREGGEERKAVTIVI